MRPEAFRLVREVHLTDSFRNPPEALARLVTTLEALGGLENMQVSGDVHDTVVAQSGAADAGAVRRRVKEKRKLSPAEVAEVPTRRGHRSGS